jgi:eukaryotic-like serine/threonine-protein kinase
VIGTEISHYRILAQLGRGGMGDVYLAEDLVLGRKAALKFLPGAAADDSGRTQLVREAQAAAGLDHPFICKIYEVGESAGRPFIAMEYVEGTTLRERLAGTRLPVALAIRLASELAEALDLAHQRGIVHRDFKPPNVMLPPDGHVKVMDFGLAKQIVAGTDDSAAVATMVATQSGALAGTLAYMSPEQLHGLPLDARSDIFAFGLVLHEMVTGAHPFRRASPISTTDAILNDSEPTIEAFVPDAPPPLGRIISRCLAKNRDERYQSIRDVRFELQALAGDSASTLRRPPARAIRRRAGLTAAAAVLVAAAAALWWFAGGAPPRALAFKERDWIVVADFENLTGDAVFDRSLRTASEVGLAQSPFVNVFPSSRVQDTLKRMQKPGADRLDESLAAEVAVREGARAVLSGSIAQVGDVYSLTMRVVDPHSRVAVLSEAAQVKGKDQLLPALDGLATRVRRRLGESLASVTSQSVPLPKATTASLDALKMYADGFRSRNADTGDELLRQAIALDQDFAMAHAELGRRLYLRSEPSARVEGERHFVKALGLLDRLSARERLWIRASAEDSRGNRRQAVDAFRSYLAQYPDDARAWFRLGWTQMAGLGEPEAAIESFKRSLALNPSDPSTRVNLATCYMGLRRYREGVDEYERAFAVDPELLTGEFVNSEYGFTLVQLGQIDKASETFAKMVAAGNKARGLRSLALLDMYRGRYAAALPRLREAILISQTNGARVSEYRDRLFLVRALDAGGLSDAAGAELAVIDRLIAQTALGPEWISMAAKIEARRGRLPQVRKLLETMSKTGADMTAGSSTNRDAARDTMYFDLVRGEIALAERRPADAVARFEAARIVDPRLPSTIESLAAALAAAGRLDEAVARYEELIAWRPLGNEGQEDWLRAHVRAGELYERLGRAGDARRTYEQLLTIWKDGDSQIAARTEAEAGLAKLGAAR